MWRLQVAETRLPALKLSRELLAAAQAEDDLASEDALLQVLEAGFAELREIGDMTLRSLAVVFFARLTEGADMEHQGENCAFGTLRELCGSYEAEAQKALERLKQIFS